MDYENFLDTDFATDDSFCQWVLNPTIELDTFWIDWLIVHTDKRTDIQSARRLVLVARTESALIPSETILDAMWEVIAERIEEKPKIIALGGWRSAWLAAACVVLLLGAYIVNRYYINDYKTYDTTYGEIRRFQLADGTMVTLNANSSLRVATPGRVTKVREAWLQGEAFFKVKKQKLDGELVKFRVHTADVVVEVKGTEFDVDTRRDKTRVILSEGNVQLRLVNEKQDILQMKPGDLVDFSKSRNTLEIQKLDDTTSWHSWKDNQWSFENTPLADVATLITETFGVDIILQEISPERHKVTGIIPSDNLEDILSSLESIMDIRVERHEKQILIQSISK